MKTSATIRNIALAAAACVLAAACASQRAGNYDKRPDNPAPLLRQPAPTSYNLHNSGTFPHYTKVNGVNRTDGKPLFSGGRYQLYRTKEATYVTADYRPSWPDSVFYRFEGKCAIIDSKTGDRYMLRRVEHFPTDTCFWVHNPGEWNYNRFVLVFPPLPAKVKTVDFFMPDGPSRKLFDGTGKRAKNINVAELRPKPAVEKKRGRTIY